MGKKKEQEEESRCILCGGATIGIKCKIICKNCGWKRDCSDP